MENNAATAITVNANVDAVPDADQFRAGDVWESPRGTRYTVIRVTMRVAHMVNETTHRTDHRAYDALGWATTVRPWVRISSGTKITS
jgi:hypothetical protein